jgi:hypothetical protein
MTDLKPYYDRVISAQANLQAVVNEIDTAMALGTPEGEAAALALESKLDEATAKVEAAEAFYAKIQKGAKTSTAAKNFVPVSTTDATDGEAAKKGVMKRADFDALEAFEKSDFVKSGGKIED